MTLQRELRVMIASYDGEYIPMTTSNEKLIARHFNIDLTKVEQERRAILEAIRQRDSNKAE